MLASWVTPRPPTSCKPDTNSPSSRIETGSRSGHDGIFWEHEGNRAVRQGKWKLVSRWNKEDGGQWELYDLDADRTEMKNLAASNPEKTAELVKMYEDWAQRAGVVEWKSWEKEG